MREQLTEPWRSKYHERPEVRLHFSPRLSTSLMSCLKRGEKTLLEHTRHYCEVAPLDRPKKDVEARVWSGGAFLFAILASSSRSTTFML